MRNETPHFDALNEPEVPFHSAAESAELSPAAPAFHSKPSVSPGQFEPKLDVPVRARSHHRVARRYVGSRVGCAKRITPHRRVVVRQVTRIHTAEDRMVENIEELGSELCGQPLFEFPVLEV